MTYLELQEEVQQNVIDLPPSVLVRVPRFVQRAHRKLHALRNFYVMRAEATFTTTADTRVLGAMPDDWKQARGRPYMTEDTDGHVRPISWALDTEQALRMFPAEYEGRPYVLTTTEEPDNTTALGNFEVYPLPDGISDYSDGEYRITVPYWRYLPSLSADGDADWFTETADQWIIAKATAYGFRADWDMPRAGEWDVYAREEWQDIVRADKLRWLSQVDTLVPHTGARDPMIDI